MEKTLIETPTTTVVEFESVWDEGTVTTQAVLNLQTGEVTDIESSDGGENYEHLQYEEIRDVSRGISAVATDDGQYFLNDLGMLVQFGGARKMKQFDFKVSQKPHSDGTVPEDQKISVEMTQEQFEDHQAKLDFVHEGIRAIGLNPAEVHWFESPLIDEATELAFKELIGAAPEAQLIAYYPHSFHHRYYKEACLNGVKYLYMGFQNGHFIKFAQSVSQLNLERAVA